MARRNEVNLGDEVKDLLTGVKGLAVGVTTWLNGCRRIVIQPQATKPGAKPPDNFSADEPTIAVVKRAVVKGENTGQPDLDAATGLRTGGPMDTPRDRDTPSRR